MKIIAIIFLLCVSTLSATAVGHFSIYTTNNLSLKHPIDKTSGVRLVSIGADGLVTIQQRDGTVLTARLEKFKTFRNQYGHTTDVQLLSVSEARDRVVIRTEMRVYPVPPKKSLEPPPGSALGSAALPRQS
jgi:hypothetical protein